MPTPTDSLLRYRPWKGAFRPPLFAAGAMARSALTILLRRKLFWALYGLAGMVFLAYFYGQYFVLWIQQFAGSARLVLFGIPFPLKGIVEFADRLNMGGTAHTFANFVWYQGHVAMIVLSLAGAVLVGNDFQHGSLPFYLSKPIGRRHYVLGKVLGVGAFVNLVITLPAVGLWVQAGLLKGWQTYYWENAHLLFGLLGYGAVLTVTLSLLLVATAVLVRRTVPLVMVWTGLFILLPVLGEFLTELQNLDPTWRLIDLWNNLYLVGLWCLGTEPDVSRVGQQPPVWQAAVVVGAVCGASWLFLRKRIRAVEIVG